MVTTTKADKRRAILVDLAIGVGVPVLVMILRMFFFPLQLPRNYSLTGETLQTILFKVIDSTFTKTLDAPIQCIIVGLHISSSTCHLYSWGSFLPPTPSQLSLPSIETVPSLMPSSQRTAATSLTIDSFDSCALLA